MTGEEQKPTKSLSSAVVLTPDQTQKLTDQMRRSGATFFDWNQFKTLTKNLPPNTPIAKILGMLRKK